MGMNERCVAPRERGRRRTLGVGLMNVLHLLRGQVEWYESAISGYIMNEGRVREECTTRCSPHIVNHPNFPPTVLTISCDHCSTKGYCGCGYDYR